MHKTHEGLCIQTIFQQIIKIVHPFRGNEFVWLDKLKSFQLVGVISKLHLNWLKHVVYLSYLRNPKVTHKKSVCPFLDASQSRFCSEISNKSLSVNPWFRISSPYLSSSSRDTLVIFYWYFSSLQIAKRLWTFLPFQAIRFDIEHFAFYQNWLRAQRPFIEWPKDLKYPNQNKMYDNLAAKKLSNSKNSKKS